MGVWMGQTLRVPYLATKRVIMASYREQLDRLYLIVSSHRAHGLQNERYC
jgi:hypothetical protein